MSKKKKVKTNAIRMVEQHKISYQEHEYAWTKNNLGAEHVAETLHQIPGQIFKTLVAKGNNTGPVVAVIPGNRELDLKKLAKVSNNKKVEMLHLKDLEQTTGYIRGGCSPIGMKKKFPTYIDVMAENYQTIMISAGKRGMQIELAPADLASLVKASFTDICEK
ncbi:MAG TPA: Cys-tRNA(Pro) deacylase [Tetragenococcus sp.]|nr:Cys-tRNA(Pro) deacylase [Tetragenococcus sp.]